MRGLELGGRRPPARSRSSSSSSLRVCRRPDGQGRAPRGPRSAASTSTSKGGASSATGSRCSEPARVRASWGARTGGRPRRLASGAARSRSGRRRRRPEQRGRSGPRTLRLRRKLAPVGNPRLETVRGSGLPAPLLIAAAAPAASTLHARRSGLAGSSPLHAPSERRAGPHCQRSRSARHVRIFLTEIPQSRRGCARAVVSSRRADPLP